MSYTLKKRLMYFKMSVYQTTNSQCIKRGCAEEDEEHPNDDDVDERTVKKCSKTMNRQKIRHEKNC